MRENQQIDVWMRFDSLSFVACKMSVFVVVQTREKARAYFFALNNLGHFPAELSKGLTKFKVVCDKRLTFPN